MPKERVSIPKKIRDAVLTEFNHRCAMCGSDRPHLHHIDENPSHNDPSNLLPLCPNCHLTDQHSPTASIHPDRLRLFRQYRDPSVLLPQFLPLFNRASFLLDVALGDEPTDELKRRADELIEFVGALEMGSFYGKRLAQLIAEPRHAWVYVLGDPASEARDREARRNWREQYRAQLREHTDEVMGLLVELLRYQTWRTNDE